MDFKFYGTPGTLLATDNKTKKSIAFVDLKRKTTWVSINRNGSGIKISDYSLDDNFDVVFSNNTLSDNHKKILVAMINLAQGIEYNGHVIESLSGETIKKYRITVTICSENCNWEIFVEAKSRQEARDLAETEFKKDFKPLGLHLDDFTPIIYEM